VPKEEKPPTPVELVEEAKPKGEKKAAPDLGGIKNKIM